MKAPVRSMTGFARVQRTLPEGEIILTLKSLNHRGLDLHFHTPPELDALENTMRTTIKKAVIRGHVDVRVSITRNQPEDTAGFNEPMLRAYLAAFRKAATEHNLPGAVPDLNMAFRLPGMFNGSLETDSISSLEPTLTEALDQALIALNEFRTREGAELAWFLLEQNRFISDTCAQIDQIRSRAMPLYYQRLQEKLRDLLRNSNLEPQRLTQEAALLADRSDIGEEVARLGIHAKQLELIVSNGGEVGKKLDFLLQEMNRETNTILSKTSGIGELGLKITDLAIAAKSYIEKIREQALNLE